MKNQYPFPLIHETFMRVSKAKWFTKLVHRGAYNLVRFAKGLGMENRLWNPFQSLWVHGYGWQTHQHPCLIPTLYQQHLGSIFGHLVCRLQQRYPDWLKQYGGTWPAYTDFPTSGRNSCSVSKAEKCQFHVQRTKYLGLILYPDRISRDPAKVAPVQPLPGPKSVKGVQTFLGFANFYYRFIQGYSEVVSLFTVGTKKGITFPGERMPNELFNHWNSRTYCSNPNAVRPGESHYGRNRCCGLHISRCLLRTRCQRHPAPSGILLKEIMSGQM